MNRNKEDRTFLHDFATPMSVLKFIVNKLAASSSQVSVDDRANFSSMIEKAQLAIAKMETTHADFKTVIYERELADEKKGDHASAGK